MFKILILFAILGISRSNGQLVSAGECNLGLVHHAEKLNSRATTSTKAYEISRIKNSWNTGQCASWNIAVTNNDIHVSRSEVADRKLIERNATTHINIDGSLTISFPDFTSNFTFIGGSEVSVEVFSILYACSNQGSNKQEYAWVLSNSTTFSESAKNLTQQILKGFKLDTAVWEEISHSTDACKSGGISHVQLSSIFVLIVGFMILKEL